MSTTPKTKPAVQLVLGSQAAEFPLPITVKKLDGTEATVVFTCRALRKTAWAKARDAHQQDMMQRAMDTPTAERPTEPEAVAAYVATNGVHHIVSRGLQADAALVLHFAAGWDLAEDLTADTLCQLEDEFGGTVGRVLSGFEAAIYQGRLGN